MESSNKDRAREVQTAEVRTPRSPPLPCPEPSPPLRNKLNLVAPLRVVLAKGRTVVPPSRAREVQTGARRGPPPFPLLPFRDGRGRAARGRGRAPGRGSPFDNHDVDDDDDDDDPVPARRERRYDVFFPPSDDDADARSASASRSAGADLEALFAECDQAALPRQHPHTYMDPSWAVDDLPELERVLGATASDAGDMSLDPVALAEKLAALPLAELLGLSREYVEYMHGDEARDERTADTSVPTPSDEDSNPRPVDAETKDHGRRAASPEEQPAAAPASKPRNRRRRPRSSPRGRCQARGGRRNAVGTASTIEAGTNAHVEGCAEDDELDELLGETRLGGFASRTTTRTTGADDDAFLGRALGLRTGGARRAFRRARRDRGTCRATEM